jgi:hypothetical protein
LLIPTKRIHGIESPIVRAPNAPNYFAKAWEVRNHIDEALHLALPRDDVGLAIFSVATRSQDQMHIHFPCVRTDVWEALHNNEAKIGDRWPPFGAPLYGRYYWRSNASGETSTNEIRHVFIMAGASPRTNRLSGCLALDNKGFILTGRDLDAATETPVWSLARPPQMLETSLPGVFAVGDVRPDNVKRVAAAVGEGSIAIGLVHRALAEL